MRIAIVHDDLVQWGGAERVLEGLCNLFPNAPIFTSVFDKNNPEIYKRFGLKKVVTSFLQKIPSWKKLYKSLLPLYPIAFEQFDFSDFDLVISHTTRFAKSIITKPKTVHLCYCHTPPRFLWHFSREENFSLAEIFLTKLRVYDQISARRVDHFVAGSKNAKERIKKIYKKESKVIYPFVDLKRFANIDEFNGGYMLVISRLNKYKRVDLAVEACQKLGIPLKIIGVGPDMDNLKRLSEGRVVFLGNLADEYVSFVLAGAKALILPGFEDFGLTSLEAQALGKPIIAFRAGGALESVIEGKTGVFFDSQTIEDLVNAIEKLSQIKIDPKDCRENACKFSLQVFTQNFKQTIATLL